MTLQEAIPARHSVRAYTDQPITGGTLAALQQKIDEVNSAGDLHVQLILDEPKAFSGTIAKYGRFRGVRNYLVMAGKKAGDLDERVGYYGEQIVLLAQTLGLNTCWVGISYSKTTGAFVLDKDEKVNQQKFHFEYVGLDGGSGKPKVLANKGTSIIGFTQMDLGIVKYHFEVGAGKDKFEWK